MFGATVLGAAGASGTTGYSIANSLRFDGVDDYLSRTFGTVNDNKQWAVLIRCKRSTLGTNQHLFSAYADNSNYFDFRFNTSDQLYIQNRVGGVNLWLANTTAVFRDTTAWYNILFVFDSANGTAAYRNRLYVNDVEYTWSANSGSSDACAFNVASRTHYFGVSASAGMWAYFSGYGSDIYVIDDFTTPPTWSDFGELNADGVYVPKAFTVTATGNNCHLDFSDGTSTTTLGYDAAGSNDWTLTGMTRAAGTTECWVTDSPTDNFCVLNGTWLQGPNWSAAVAISNGSLTATNSNASNYSGAYGTIQIPTSGKWYFEVTDTTAGSQAVVGIARGDFNRSNAKRVYNSTDGNKYTESGGAAYGNTWTANDVIGVAVDTTNGKIWFAKNNTWQSSGDPAAGTNAAYTDVNSALPAEGWFPHGYGYNGNVLNFNFGQRAFTYTPPTGFKALSTANLPTVSITNPREHFDIIGSRTGTAGTYNSNTTKALLFQPDMVWIKSRGRAVDHAIYDSVRGVQKRLESNNTDAEVTGDTTGLTAFNSDGYSGGALDQINGTTATNNFVDWFWRAGGEPTTDNVAGAGNTPTAGSVKIDGVNLGSALAGTIAATRLSANTTAGFSIVTYTGTGANGATVGHGLGVAPKMVIVKQLQSAGGSLYNWNSYHFGVDATAPQDYFIALNSTNARTAYSTADLWSRTQPSTTVVTLGGATGGAAAVNNYSGVGYVAYCFAEISSFSKAFSLTGNASTDGVFQYLGFRPALVLLKCSSTTGNWYLFDTVRNTYNVLGEQLYPNLSNAGSTVTTLDALSNGFKLRISTDPNASATYIGFAWAAHPFGGSNVSPCPAF